MDRKDLICWHGRSKKPNMHDHVRVIVGCFLYHSIGKSTFLTNGGWNGILARWFEGLIPFLHYSYRCVLEADVTPNTLTSHLIIRTVEGGSILH